MQALGNYLLRSRIHAMAVTSLLTVVSILVSPLAYLISGTPVGLVTLRKGPAVGVQVIMGCMLITMLLGALGDIDPAFSLVFTTIVWLPVLLCSLVLRMTQAQGMMVLSAGAIGFCFIILIHGMLEQITQWWQQLLVQWKESAVSGEVADQYQQVFEAFTPLLSVMLLSGFFISLVLTVLLGRWWQSALFNPGGFRQEFYALRLPRWLLYITLGVIAVMLLDRAGTQLLSRDIMVMLMLMYMFQGLSTTHRFVQANRLRITWLVALYILLLLLPHMVLFVACIGLADAWLGKSEAYVDNDRGGRDD